MNSLLAFCLLVPLYAGQPDSPPPAAAPAAQAPAMDKKAMSAAIEQRGGPVEQHKNLEPLVGDFNIEIRMSVAPGQPSLIAHAKGTGRWILGKRFVQTETEPAPGEDLKVYSQSTFGFDKRSGKYFWFGIDSTDTYSVFAEGDYDEATRTFTLKGENEEPGVGTLPFKTILKLVSDEERLMQVWFQYKGAPGADEDGWFKVVEMSYKRAQ